MTIRTRMPGLAAIAAAGLLALSGAAGAQTTLKLGTILPDDNILTQNARLFAQLVDEKTAGRVKVEVYPASQLGNERDLTEGMQIGTVEMAEVSGGVLSAFAPEVGVFSLPFVFRGWDHLTAVLQSDVADDLNQIVLERTGLRVLGWMQQGFRVVLTDEREIAALDDFRGLKIRVPEDRILIRTFELVGAAPTVIPWGDVYTALQTGLVEGMESTTPAMYAMKFHEVANHIAVTNHQHSVVAFLISDAVWQQIPAEDQQAIAEATQEMLAVNYREAEETASGSLDLLRAEVASTTDIDVAPFQAAVEPLYAEFGSQTGTTALIERIAAIQ